MKYQNIPRADPKRAMQSAMVNPQRITPIREQTNPAVLWPLANPIFFDLTENTSPIIPQARPGIAASLRSASARDMIPRIIEVVAYDSALDGSTFPSEE